MGLNSDLGCRRHIDIMRIELNIFGLSVQAAQVKVKMTYWHRCRYKAEACCEGHQPSVGTVLQSLDVPSELS